MNYVMRQGKLIEVATIETMVGRRNRDQFLGGAQVLVGVGVDEADDLLFPLADGDRVIRFLAKKS